MGDKSIDDYRDIVVYQGDLKIKDINIHKEFSIFMLDMGKFKPVDLKDSIREVLLSGIMVADFDILYH